MDGQAQGGPRVLLVDDDPDLLIELQDGLEVMGIPALTASTVSSIQVNAELVSTNRNAVHAPPNSSWEAACRAHNRQ